MEDHVYPLRQPKLHFGTCAWSFDHWREVFYPKGLPPTERLAFYARFLNVVEVDSTFYHTPSERVMNHWMECTPETFRFTCKLPRELSHDAQLHDCSVLLRTFLEALRPLRGKLSAILVQLPAFFEHRRNEQVFRRFIQQLPTDFRFAVEFRSRDWDRPSVVSLLQDHNVCWVWSDTTLLENQERAAFDFLPMTSDFLYLRLLGDIDSKYSHDGSLRHRYGSLLWPRDGSLENWAVKIRRHLEEEKRVLVLANNHFEGFSIATCARLAEKLGENLGLPLGHEAPDASGAEQLSLL